MPPKPDLIFHDAPNDNETVHIAFNVELRPTKPDNDLSHTHRPLVPIIEDWVSDLEDESETTIPQNVPSFIQPTEQIKSPRPSVQHVETSILTHYARMPLLNPQRHVVPTAVITKSNLVPINAAKPITAAIPKPYVTRPRPAKPIVTKPHSPPRRLINRSPSPKSNTFPLQFTAVKVSQDKGVIDSRYSRHMIGNMSYLSNFEELNGGYVSFGGNPKGGKISGKRKIKTGKQHRASYKTKPVSSVDQTLYRLHMDLFGPTFVKSLNKKSYFLVVIDDYSRFTWVFFLATKDKTSPILKTFITGLGNQLSLNVKVIKSDNGTEFNNNDLNQFCGMKEIKREFSVPRNPQQNGIAKRKNRTLIEVARTILADSLLPIPFWAEAVNTACYVQNRVLVTKPYELLHGRTPSIGFIRPFGCPVTILNTLDSLGKFDGKVDEGFLV
nr:retrovirus-related Pol polyprotein from transposon TNT 1-94 [Tanacetum cinerariifolium]